MGVGFVRTDAEVIAGITPSNYAYDPGDVRRYGAVGNWTADDTSAVRDAMTALNGRGEIRVPKGVYRITSQIQIPTGVRLIGEGVSEIDSTGVASRGATCFLRDYSGTDPTFLVVGDDVGIDFIDFDNNTLGGDCLQIWGGRFCGGQISTRNGSNGLRLGKTNTGAPSDTNTNCWRIAFLLTCGNSTHGMFVDDTNNTTSLSYPLGLSNCNSGICSILDARGNGGDGCRVGNANDNLWGVVHAEGNGGCGFRFFTDTINSGPRCNTIVSNDCEGNTGNDIQIDAATMPTAAPGLYNRVLGNRSVALSSRIVDNSTGSMVMQWVAGLGFRAYHFGSDINALATTGAVGLNAYVGANNSPVRFYGVASGTVDGIARISIHKNGGGQTDGCEINQYAVLKSLQDLFIVTYSASMTIDAATGNFFQITANNGTAFTINAPTNPQQGTEIVIQIRNTSGGVLGTVTWNAVFKKAAWTSPASGNSRSITFRYNGSNWIEMCRTTADVPN